MHLLVFNPETLDAYLLHLLIRPHVAVGKFLAAEYDIETHSETSYAQEQQYGKKSPYHLLLNEFGADGLVVVDLLHDAGESPCKRDDLDLVALDLERNRVCDVHFLECR